jgi:hypothetical protein
MINAQAVTIIGKLWTVNVSFQPRLYKEG